MRKYLITLLFFLSIALSGQTTYYIDPAGTDGAAVSGDITHPWKTLYYACTRVTTSGDVIHVNEGTFNESNQSVLRVGVDIVGEGADLSEIIFTVTSTSGCINASSSSLTNGSQSISYLKLNGSNLTGRLAINASLRSNVEVHNCTIVNFLGGAVKLWGITAAGSTNRAVGNKIYNCTITNCSDRAYGAMIVLVGQDGTSIHDNILDQTDRPTGHNGNIIDAVGYTSDALGDLKGAMNVGIEFYNNKSYKPDTDGIISGASGWNFHLEFWTTKGGIHIWNNEFYGGLAIDVGGTINTKGTYDYAWFVHDNLFTMNNGQIAYPPEGTHPGGGVDIEGSTSDVIITRNHIKDMPCAIPFNIGQANRTQSRIYINYNILENIGYTDNGWGWSIPIGDNRSSTAVYEEIYIDNNVITGSSRAHIMMSSLGIIRNIYIRNNVVSGATYYGWLAFWSETGPISNIYLRNNNLYNNVNNNNIYYRSGKTVTNLVQTNNIYTNPLFVGGSPYDFHLQSISPAIDAGLDVDLSFDYDSVAVGATPEIGAYEWGITSPAVEPTLVTTVSPYWTSSTTAISGGYVTDDGGGTVTARGLCWNTTGSPTIADSHTLDGSGTGAYSSFMTGLSYTENYYVRAYATNEAGTSYGNQLIFRWRQTVRHNEVVVRYGGKIVTIGDN